MSFLEPDWLPYRKIYFIAYNHTENFEKYAYGIVDVVNAVLGMVS